MGATQEELENREILETVMQKHGFIGLPTEWWHFDLIGWENYPPIDIDPAICQ
jgi:D-alanyl-D-alanine dipeptidase